jgi:hypothetical protein
MRIVLLLVALIVLNVIFADRFLIPTKTIPSDQIIYLDDNPQENIDVLLLESVVYSDPNNQVNIPGLKKVGAYKVAIDAQARSNIGAYALKNMPEYKAVQMSNGSLELTDMKIIIQYRDENDINVLSYDYGLIKVEVMSAANVVIFDAQNKLQLNNIMTILKNDSRVMDATFNLVEMSEIPQ